MAPVVRRSPIQSENGRFSLRKPARSVDQGRGQFQPLEVRMYHCWHCWHCRVRDEGKGQRVSSGQELRVQTMQRNKRE
jgi:hypothetical protein